MYRLPILYLTLVLSSILKANAETGNGALRLIRDNQYSDTQAWSSGIVQIYYGGSWGNICDDFSFSFDEAEVICHQLGYTGSSSFGTASSITQYGMDGNATLIEDVSCSIGIYLTLLQCSVDGQYSTECSNDNLDLVINCYITRIWDSPYPGQIRLAGGEYSNQGLLEIYCNGQWGTVCDDFFGATDARVTCRQLGYNYYYTYDTLPQRGNESQSIWLNNIGCSSSTYNCLSSCFSGSCTSSTITNCYHSEDITLDCSYSSFYTASLVTEETCEYIGPNSVGAIRLLNSGSTSLYNTAGRVQVWYGGQWGNICDRNTNFGYDEADVICHQLGWSGSSTYSTGQYDSYGNDGFPAVIDDLSCSNNTYLTIFQCSYSTSVSSSCTNETDVSVSCYTTRIWNSPYVGQIRLSRGMYSNQGLLEVYCNDEWGTVCHDTFGSTDASVVCRQLGYNSYYSYGYLPITGNLSQPIWLDNVQCFSSSTSCLAYCETCPSYEYANCYHYEDITVECSISTFSSSVITTESTCTNADTGPTDSNGPNSVGAIRLLNSGSTSLYNTAGRVQVWYGGQWGNICDRNTNFGYDEADVICHQLGWSGSSTYSTGQYDSYDNDGLPAVIEDLSCSNNTYLTIFQCSYNTSVSSSCTNEIDVSVSCYTTRIWNNPYVGQIRLSRGMYSNQGLLEVYCNDEWGTVCDDTFGSTDASVVCRQLGYNSYYSYDHLSITGNISQPIWLDNVQCFSSSTSCLAYCETCPSSEYDCDHYEDITVECSISTFYSSVSTRVSTCTNADTGPTDSNGVLGPNSAGAMRLLNSGSTSLYNTAGRVQVWYGGQWGNICDRNTYFGSDEADVVCHQLGWSGSSSYSTGQYDSYDNDGLPAVIDNLSCFYSTYLTIFQCSYSTSVSSSCTSKTDVSVSCYTTRIWNSPYVGQIRLSRGMYSNQGLLEVYCNNEWGTVCDDTFGGTDASVICRQLGYNSYYSYDHLSITGNISQPIWLDNVQCFSSSTSCLAYCETCPSSEYANCVHSQDISVECSISTFGSSVSTRVSTCTNVDSGTTDSSDDSTSTINVGGVVGGTSAGTISIIILLVCLRLCILGIRGVRCMGIGSSFRRTPRTTVVGRTTEATTTTVLANESISKDIETPTNAYSTNPQDPPPAYPAQGYNQNYPTQQQGYPQQQNYPQQSQPYPGQQGYPMTPYSTQPQQPPPTYPAYSYPPGGSEYPPQQAPYPNQDMSNIHQQPPPPYPGTQSTQFGFPEPQPF